MIMGRLKALLGPTARHVILRLKHTPPRGLKRLGRESFIVKPCIVEGASCIEIGDNVRIYHESWLNVVERYAGEQFAPSLRIEDNVCIGSFCCITCADEVVIERDVVLSRHVYISDCSHGISPTGGSVLEQKLNLNGKVRIGAGSFLGYRASIMPGVTLGKHCVVGVNAVVTKSFPAYSMVVGAPAKLIKTYSHDRGEWVSS